VDETLLVPCFHYQGQPFTTPILVRTDDNGRRFVRCPVRGYMVCLTPEEQVRQALVWFLSNGARGAAALSQRMRIGVEERSLDVAGFASGEEIDARFAPSITAVVFETKREESEIGDYVGQLEGYMRRERCRAGMLFNARQATWATLNGDSPNTTLVIDPLTDLCEAEERIHDVAMVASDFLRTCRGHFMAARDGNFDALANLVALFGGDASLTFSLSIKSKDSLGLVGAFNLSVVSNREIGYWIKGMATKRKQILTRTVFHSLRSVQP
jgi:hypothetical protein